MSFFHDITNQNTYLDKNLADDYFEEEEEYYFDRHLPSFPAILYYYQTGCQFIWRPLDVPMDKDINLQLTEFAQTLFMTQIYPK